MPDKGDAPGLVADLCRRPVVVRTGPPLGPARSGSGQPPANEIDEAARLRAVGVKEARTIEMVRQRAVVVARQRASAENPEESGGGEAAQRGNDAAARGGHPRSRSRKWGTSSERKARPAAAGSLGVRIVDAE